MTIGELARSADTSVETIRFYEREGLVDEPQRTPSGYRAYGDDAVSRLKFIHRAQALGFSLKEIRELIALQTNPSADCGAVRHAAEEKLRMVEEKTAALLKIKTELERMVTSCSGDGPIATCSIIDCMSHD